MQKLKSHKTVEQIAKKHRMDVSFIQKQLDIGQPIEHEHTKDPELAMDIALQHLDEIPDYYTRLKKMEASAKKEYKKIKESMEEKRYCPICDKREGRSECSYGEKVWDKVSVKDEEYSMARSELKTMSDAIKRLQMKVGKGEGNLEAWVQSKITKAADYIDTAADYVVGGEMEEACWKGYKKKGMKTMFGKKYPNCVKEEGLRDWFGKSKSKDGKSGWVNVVTGGTCASDEPGEGTPKCVSSSKRASMTDEERKSAARRKKLADPGQQSKSGAAKPTYVATDVKEETDKKTKGSGTKDACYTKVKSRYSVWPSAYASGALVKCRKVGATNWGNNTNEDVTIEDLDGNTFAEVIDLIKPEPITGFKSQVKEATRLQADTGNIIAVILSWRGKTYSVRMFFPQVGMPNKNDITTEIQKIYPSALVLQYKVSSLQPGMPLIQVVNSKSKNYLLNNKTIGEEKIEEVAAWQRKEGKNPEGGLNAAGVASYRRENPGSKLQTAVTTEPSKLKPDSKDAKRRKSFCARMGGMPGPMKDEKGRPTRKALSLRKWNC